ncbi:MAG: ClpXP protease specificity-enhancing factor SspB [Acidobacteriota bacterium]
MDERIDYQLLIQRALRSVLRQVLQQVAEEGLPGGHHFYIGFRTDLPGVTVPPRLRKAYPQEMTIVLQHQFWNLTVSSDRFSVELSFGGRREPLDIPFRALTSFADPEADFGLRLQPETPGGGGPQRLGPRPLEAADAVRAEAARRGLRAVGDDEDDKDHDGPDDDGPDNDGATPSADGHVVDPVDDADASNDADDDGDAPYDGDPDAEDEAFFHAVAAIVAKHNPYTRGEGDEADDDGESDSDDEDPDDDPDGRPRDDASDDDGDAEDDSAAASSNVVSLDAFRKR